MGMFSDSYKGKITFNATTGAPEGVAEVAKASVVDGAIGGLTGLLDGGTSFYTGTAKTVGEVVKLGIAIAGTSKFTTGSFIPRKPL